MNIYIANIPFKANENELRELFEAYGQVASAKIVLDKETQRSRGFGFVEMSDDAEGAAAIEGLNGSDFQGKTLTVNEARPREPRQEYRPRPNGGSGGYQQRSAGYSGGGYQQRSNNSGNSGGFYGSRNERTDRSSNSNNSSNSSDRYPGKKYERKEKTNRFEEDDEEGAWRKKW